MVTDGAAEVVIEGVSKRYGRTLALDDVSLSVGRNGSKATRTAAALGFWTRFGGACSFVSDILRFPALLLDRRPGALGPGG